MPLLRRRDSRRGKDLPMVPRRSDANHHSCAAGAGDQRQSHRQPGSGPVLCFLSGRSLGDCLALAGLILGYFGVALVPMLIITAIAIPNLLRAKMAANEASAVGSLRALNITAVTYSTKYGHVPATFPCEDRQESTARVGFRHYFG